LLTQGGSKEKSPRKRRRRGGVRNRQPGEGAAEQAPDTSGGSDD
jgi:poly(A) polymerase